MEKKTNIHDELIEGCRRFDEISQFKIYKLYAKAMLNTSFRITNNMEDAEDAVQEAFTNAFNNILKYRADSTFGAWLKRIVVNKSITLAQKQQRQVNIDEANVYDPVESENDDAYILENTEMVRAEVMSLPDGFRQVLTLYLFEGYDHVEISEILSISVSTSKSQYMRAKEKLRSNLKMRRNYG